MIINYYLIVIAIYTYPMMEMSLFRFCINLGGVNLLCYCD